MRTIKTYCKRAPFYNAFLGTNPTGELITSGLLVLRECLQSVLTSLLAATNRTKSAAILGKDRFASLWTSRPCWRSGSSPPNAAGSLPDLTITETIDEVIVYHADGLHMSVHDRRTNETESAMLEVPAECIGFG